MKLISGSSNTSLAEGISSYLNVPLTKTVLTRFSDGENFVEIKENVRGQDVFVVQSTSNPANDHLMELLITIDALRRGSAKRITAVIPYFGYSRQDRKTGPRTPITAKLVSDLIVTAGVNRVLTMDLHSAQIQGFFNVPVDNLYAAPAFIKDISREYSDVVIVSPDAGGVVRARHIADRLNADLAIIDKRKQKANQSEVMNIIGEVSGRRCLIIDDMVDTAGTLCHAAKALKDEGAQFVGCYATHGVLSGPAFERIEESPLDQLVVTNTISQNGRLKESNKIRQLDMSSLLGEAIHRISQSHSVSDLFV